MNKPLTTISLLCLVAALLVGCGGDASTPTTAQSSNTTNTSQNAESQPTETTEETDSKTSTDPITVDETTTETQVGFKGSRRSSVTDGVFQEITDMALGSCSGNCYVLRGGVIDADKRPILFAAYNKKWHIVRLQSNGKTLDKTFAENGVLTGMFAGEVAQYGWDLDSSGRLLLLHYDSWTGHSVSRYTRSGILDTSFGNSGVVLSPTIKSPATVVELKDNKILIGGKYTASSNNLSGASQWSFTLLTTDGVADTRNPEVGYFVFNQPNPSKYSQLKQVVETEDYLYLMGTTERYGYALGRITKADMSLDTSFGENGFVTVLYSNESVINDVIVDSKGRIVLVGSGPGGDRVNVNKAGMAFYIYRFLTNGLKDTNFGTDGLAVVDFGFKGAQTQQINDSAVSVFEEQHNKLIVAGQSGSITGTIGRSFAMVRLLENGDIDTSFEFGKNRLQADYQSSLIYFANVTSEPTKQSVILDDQQGGLVGYGVVTDRFGNIDTTTPLKVQWWD